MGAYVEAPTSSAGAGTLTDTLSDPRAPTPDRTVGSSTLRRLSRADVPSLVDLHRRAFGAGKEREQLAAFLEDVFFGHPWVDVRHPSIGLEDSSGKLVGCLGVMRRPMTLDRRPVRVVVSHNLIVHPNHRGGLSALRLLSAVARSEAQLTIAEPTRPSLELCKRLGATVLTSRSGRWLRVLRPARLLATTLRGRGVPQALTRIIAGMGALPDAVAALIPGSPSRVHRSSGPDAAVGPGVLAELVDRFTADIPLCPSYDARSSAWIMDRLHATNRTQRLKANQVLNAGKTIGWYVYYSRCGDIGRVLQLGGAPGQESLVLAHLFADALRDGNAALAGAADPPWEHALRQCGAMRIAGSTMLVAYARDPRLLELLAGPGAFFTRLEGEGWLRFAY